MISAFDADVLIYAAVPGHPLGVRVRRQLEDPDDAAVGSVLLLTEVLAKPLRERREDEVASLIGVLGRLELRPVDDGTGRLALTLAVAYGLRAADAVHLATAVAAGADRFVTNNRKDFPASITEIDVVYPDALV